MFVVTVLFEVRQSAAADFLQALLRQAKTSLDDEERCRVFDVAVEPARDNVFFLYELYDTEADFQAHLKTPHFLAFDSYAQPLTINKTVTTWQLASVHDGAASASGAVNR